MLLTLDVGLPVSRMRRPGPGCGRLRPIEVVDGRLDERIELNRRYRAPVTPPFDQARVGLPGARLNIEAGDHTLVTCRLGSLWRFSVRTQGPRRRFRSERPGNTAPAAASPTRGPSRVAVAISGPDLLQVAMHNGPSLGPFAQERDG
jgi:hypothetical protein